MARRTTGRGRLMALEGTSGPNLAATAKRLLRHACAGSEAGGISEWDASNIFYELSRGDPVGLGPSPRTLLLLYAADLAFRLRWEIRPALEEGLCVIAAPYIESAMAFGRATGVPRPWLKELFRFAPKPQICYRVRERRDRRAPVPPGRDAGPSGPGPGRARTSPGKRSHPSEGYLEFCSRALAASSLPWNTAELREKCGAYLDALERRGGCRTVTAGSPA